MHIGRFFKTKNFNFFSFSKFPKTFKNLIKHSEEKLGCLKRWRARRDFNIVVEAMRDFNVIDIVPAYKKLLYLLVSYAIILKIYDNNDEIVSEPWRGTLTARRGHRQGLWRRPEDGGDICMRSRYFWKRPVVSQMYASILYERDLYEKWLWLLIWMSNSTENDDTT